MFFNTLILALPALSVVAASGHQSQHGHHSSAVKAKKAEIDARLNKEGKAATFDVEKRQASNARFTYYDTSVGLGACGNYNANDVWTVALNSDQLDAAGGYSSYPPSVCGKSITITYGGKTAVATIQDECPTCPYGGLDLSPGLFTHFAEESVGVIYGTWAYGSDSSDTTTTSTSTTTSTTSTYTPTTTSTTWTPDPTTSSTSTYTPPTTTWTPTTSSTEAYTPETSSTPSTTSTWVAPTSSSSSYVPASSSSSAVFSSSASSGSYSLSVSASASASASASSVSSSVSVAEESSAASSVSGSASASASASASGITGTLTGNNIEKLGELVSNLGGAICAGNDQCA